MFCFVLCPCTPYAHIKSRTQRPPTLTGWIPTDKSTKPLGSNWKAKVILKVSHPYLPPCEGKRPPPLGPQLSHRLRWSRNMPQQIWSRPSFSTFFSVWVAQGGFTINYNPLKHIALSRWSGPFASDSGPILVAPKDKRWRSTQHHKGFPIGAFTFSLGRDIWPHHRDEMRFLNIFSQFLILIRKRNYESHFRFSSSYFQNFLKCGLKKSLG